MGNIGFATNIEAIRDRKPRKVGWGCKTEAGEGQSLPDTDFCRLF